MDLIWLKTLRNSCTVPYLYPHILNVTILCNYRLLEKESAEKDKYIKRLRKEREGRRVGKLLATPATAAFTRVVLAGKCHTGTLKYNLARKEYEEGREDLLELTKNAMEYLRTRDENRIEVTRTGRILGPAAKSAQTPKPRVSKEEFVESMTVSVNQKNNYRNMRLVGMSN